MTEMSSRWKSQFKDRPEDRNSLEYKVWQVEVQLSHVEAILSDVHDELRRLITEVHQIHE
jgi:hypothetical protein